MVCTEEAALSGGTAAVPKPVPLMAVEVPPIQLPPSTTKSKNKYSDPSSRASKDRVVIHSARSGPHTARTGTRYPGETTRILPADPTSGRRRVVRCMPVKVEASTRVTHRTPRHAPISRATTPHTVRGAGIPADVLPPRQPLRANRSGSGYELRGPTGVPAQSLVPPPHSTNGGETRRSTAARRRGGGNHTHANYKQFASPGASSAPHLPEDKAARIAAWQLSTVSNGGALAHGNFSLGMEEVMEDFEEPQNLPLGQRMLQMVKPGPRISLVLRR